MTDAKKSQLSGTHDQRALIVELSVALKTARQTGGLSQRELSQQLGVPELVLRKLECAELEPGEALLATLSDGVDRFDQIDRPEHADANTSAVSPDQRDLSAVSPDQRDLSAVSPDQRDLSAVSPDQRDLSAVSLSRDLSAVSLSRDLSKLRAALNNITQATRLQVGMPFQHASQCLAPEQIFERARAGVAARGYELIECIGEGGFGSVYRARQRSVGRDVAIKVIKAELANDVDFIRRFAAEAELVAQLEHANIVPLYDFWRDPGAAFMVMRLMKGGSLSQHLKARMGADKLPVKALPLLPLLHQVAQALNAAHRYNIVHRDFKPANILLDEQGNAVLADFGVAKQLNQDSDRTAAGEIVGSLAYCAPEQLRGEAVSAATDVYALGLVAYELITGQRPFTSNQASLLVSQHLHDQAPAPSELVSQLPAPVDQVIARALSKQPDARYPDTVSFAHEIELAFRGMDGSWISNARMALGEFATPTSKSFLQLSDADNPYQGLAAFDEGQAKNFFGREGLVELLISKLSDRSLLSRALVLLGASGSGKSSAVRAGLLPALRNNALAGSKHWLLSTMTPGRTPFANLAAAIRRVSVREFDVENMLRQDAFGFSRAIDRSLPNEEHCELLLVVDQFEELFTLCAEDAERRAWIAALSTALLDSHARLRVVFTLRADFLDRPLQYVELSEIVRDRAVIVPAMTLDELERAIVGPARRIGLVFEPGLVAAILDEVRDQIGALPLLQFALSELYLQRRGQELTLAAFKAIGGVQGALAGRAEAAFAELDSAAQKSAQQLFLRLVTLGEGSEDTRRRTFRSELDELTHSAESSVDRSVAAMSAAIAGFEKARLLSFDRDQSSHANTVEVAHEALIRNWQRLRHWLSHARGDLRLQRQLAEAARLWHANARDSSYLLSGARLHQLAILLSSQDVHLTELERSFLTLSHQEQAQQIQLSAQRNERELHQAQALAEQQRQAAESARAATEVQRRGNTRLRWLLLISTGFLAVAFWQALTISSRGKALRLETERANIEAKSARVLSDFWQELFANADPNRSKGKALSVRDVLDVGVAQLDAKLRDAPEARARLMLTIAKTYRQLGEFELAKNVIDQAQPGASNAAADGGVLSAPLEIDMALERARIYADLKLGDLAIAALARVQALQDLTNAPPLQRATTLNIWASVLNDQGKTEVAVPMLLSALALREKNGAQASEIARTLNNLAFSYAKLSDGLRAAEFYRKSSALQENSDTTDAAFTWLNLGNAERSLSHFGAADVAYARAYALLQKLFPAPGLAHPALANVLIDRATLQRMQLHETHTDRSTDAVAASFADFAQAEEILRANKGSQIALRRERGLSYLSLGKPELARLEFELCLGDAHTVVAKPNMICRYRLAQAQFALGQAASAASLLSAVLVELKSEQNPTMEYLEASVLSKTILPTQFDDVWIRAQLKQKPDSWRVRQLWRELDGKF